MAQGGKKKKDKALDADRARLKADVMCLQVEPGKIHQRSGEIWLRRARGDGQEEKITMAVMEEIPKPIRPEFREVEQIAIKLAMQIPKEEVLNKLKALDTCVAIAKSRQDIRYYLARRFPQLKGSTCKVINEMLEYWAKWDADSFKTLFHMTRVFFEAKCAGFQLGGTV